MPVPQARREQQPDVLSVLQQQRLSELRQLHTSRAEAPELSSDASRQLLLFRNQLRSVPRGTTASREFWGEECPFSSDSDRQTSEAELLPPSSRDAHEAPMPMDRTGIQPCCFLAPGQRFSGKQQVARHAPISSGLQEDWDMELHIQEVDLDRGRAAGSISVDDKQPSSRGPVATFWEGEIVDNEHATFLLSKWGASPQVHMRHWSKFESFGAIQQEVRLRRGRCSSLHCHSYVYLRLKEKFFITSSEDSGLTIAGWYYLALSRKTGSIIGYYYDSSSSPFQKLVLHPQRAPSCGVSLGRYELYQD